MVRALNRQHPFSQYFVTWQCGRESIKELLVAHVERASDGSRRFILPDKPIGMYEQFRSLLSLGMFAGSTANAALFYWLAIGILASPQWADGQSGRTPSGKIGASTRSKSTATGLTP
jgi:hypothetical protein